MKTVFVQVEGGAEEVKKVCNMLGGIQQTDYFFAVLPADSKLLSKSDIRTLLKTLEKEM